MWALALLIKLGPHKLLVCFCFHSNSYPAICTFCLQIEMNVPATHTPVTPAFQPVWMKREIIAAIAFRVTPRDQTTSFVTVCMIYGCTVVNSVSALNKWLFDDTNWTSWAKWSSDNIACISYVAWHIREALYVLSIFMTAMIIIIVIFVIFLLHVLQ